jgi:integrase
MKKAPDFAGTFAADLMDYCNHMVANGRNFRVETTILKAFDRYTIENLITGITDAVVTDFTYSRSDISQAQYDKRHRVVRKFTEYLSLQHKSDAVRPLPGSTKPPRHIPHIYTQDEINRLLTAVENMNPVPKLKPHTYRVLLGLLLSTGMRISEAINLDVSDIDFDSGVLRIRMTKFKKSRLVPVHPTTLEQLRNYDSLRRNLVPVPNDDAFFINKYKKRLTYHNINATFLELVRSAGLRMEEGSGPRIHDTRHTFATARIAKWHDEGLDIHQMLPLLSTYMGHSHYEDTVYYLTVSAELMAKGSERFTKEGMLNG